MIETTEYFVEGVFLLIIGTFGIIGNVAAIVVFTRQNLQKSFYGLMLSLALGVAAARRATATGGGCRTMRRSTALPRMTRPQRATRRRTMARAMVALSGRRARAQAKYGRSSRQAGRFAHSLE